MVSIKSLPAAYTNHTTRSQVFESYEQAESHIMDHLLLQPNLFEALQLAHQINMMNGYQVVSTYQFTLIKKHFRQKEIVKIKTEIIESHSNSFSKKQNGNVLKGNQNSKNKKSNFQKEYQKAYMKLNTNQKESNQYDQTI